MNLSKLASIAEIVASIGVILSLIFVGLQVSDSNQETRAATMQAALDSEMFLGATMTNHPEAWEKVITGAPLEDDTERRLGNLLYNLLMVESENRFHQFNAGYLDPQTWEGRVSSLRPLVALPIYEFWRETPGGANHSADFLEFLDDLNE